MLLDISAQATRIVLTSFIFLGTIGNVLNLLIFTRPTLLRSSCTLYLIATSIDNILVIYTSVLTRLLATGFNYDITIISDLLCKLRFYPGYVFLAVSPYFYILACFDRYCSSSTSATRRSWCDKKIAIRLIIGAIILASILYLHIIIFFERLVVATGFYCYARAGIYNTFYRIFYLVVYCILPPFCMSLLSILTLKNIRQQARRTRPALAIENQSLRRIDQQMVRMLFSQVLIELLGVLPHATLNLTGLFVNTSTTIYTFFSQITVLPLFVSYAISFYVYTLSSRVYRQELMKIIWFWKPRQNENELTIRTIPTNTITLQQRNINTVDIQEL
jgi:hypothetical protein